MTPTLTVSECIAAINQTLEYAYNRVIVVGEVSSYNENQGKYIFLDIKDEDGVLNCFAGMWTVKVPIEVGMTVQIVAVPKITNKGRFSLTIQAIKPVGEGAIKRSFDLLKEKLQKEGLFEQSRKRLLPTTPKRIAVVSSKDAAGYGDFITILGERWGGLEIELAHVQVQGDVAPEQIVRAIKYFNAQSELADVLVVLRGGGSVEDLQAFNDERVVRAVAASRIPTMSAIGHERDVTLCDMVADVRASTPSNAAERLVPDRRVMIERLHKSIHTALVTMQEGIEDAIVTNKQRVVDAVDIVSARILDEATRLGQLRATLRAFNPRLVLERGYALVRGRVVRGETITIERTNDIITAEVKDVRQS